MSESQASGDGRTPRALRVALTILLLGGTLLVTLHDWLGLGGAGLDFLVGEVLYDAVVMGAAAACLLRASLFRRERPAWLLLGLAIGCWGLAEVYWTIFIEGNPSAPYPSPADLGYLAFYPLAYIGLALLVRARAAQMNWRLWTDGLIAALGTAALGAAFIFDFVSDRTTGTSAEVVTTLAYPLGDVALVALLVGVVALTEWRPGRTWSLLLAALAAMAVADIVYTLQWTTGALPDIALVNPIYLLSAVLLGIAVWQPETSAISPRHRTDSWRELMVPALFATVMIGLFTMQSVSATTGLSSMLWAMTMVAVIVRLGISVRENRMLLNQVQTDPLTGLGNSGRMRLDLDSLCARAGEGHPAAVVFLDLNGFKRFNDSFGHPEGDALLIRLGGRLHEAIGEDGRAYRIGGDEFCVLLTCEASRFQQVARTAAEALSENGKGFEIGASWGLAAIPEEAAEPSEALRLADVRMYAQKESRRTTRLGDEAEIAEEPDGPVKVSGWPQPQPTSDAK
jgi:two-component system cell cycle response regulator